jgi:hypothetical protein
MSSVIDYNHYHESLYCNKKYQILREDESNYFLIKNHGKELEFIKKLLIINDNDEFIELAFGNFKGVYEFLHGIVTSTSTKINQTFYLDSNFKSTFNYNKAFFSFSPDMYNYNQSTKTLTLYHFSFEMYCLKSRKPTTLSLDYCALIYQIMKTYFKDLVYIKAYAIITNKPFKIKKFSFDVTKHNDRNKLSNRLAVLFFNLISINNRDNLSVAKPSRFNCSRCPFAFTGKCNDGDPKYFNKRNLYNG